MLPAIAVTAAAGAFSLLFSWYYQPFFAERLDGVLAPQLFNLRGVDFAAWTLLAFALGAIAGVLIRRTVPAMAASLAATAGPDLATVLFLRKYYQTPLVIKGSPSYNNPPGWSASGTPLADPHRGHRLAGPPPCGMTAERGEVLR